MTLKIFATVQFLQFWIRYTIIRIRAHNNESAKYIWAYICCRNLYDFFSQQPYSFSKSNVSGEELKVFYGKELWVFYGKDL